MVPQGGGVVRRKLVLQETVHRFVPVLHLARRADGAQRIGLRITHPTRFDEELHAIRLLLVRELPTVLHAQLHDGRGHILDILRPEEVHQGAETEEKGGRQFLAHVHVFLPVNSHFSNPRKQSSAA